MSALVISLDFELFWGVADSRTISSYRKNIEGALYAIPHILKLFHRYEVKATWATVGMLMCRDFEHWREISPRLTPGYTRRTCSTYTLTDIVRSNQSLFFSRPTVSKILDTPGQELATHTYSHFYCREPGASPEQFAADLECAAFVGKDLGVAYKSIVFPRNQVKPEYLPVLRQAGIKVFRGNPSHALYADGHVTPGGVAGRAVRFADSWVSLTGSHVSSPTYDDGLVNVRASQFLRPYSQKLGFLEKLRLHRIKSEMSKAAASNGVFHLWWHPHNFGLETEKNLHTLEEILQHYCRLRDSNGMRSLAMQDFAKVKVV
ncbi:polysaccharide deacetylase family protein [uncultured Massilia sp.]|uniref:polysaccharide deacetylase family protein n=1 Tax=uncultured Massilia sp. TaxID=169973 RepID=UPI0025EF1C39|nr:polysaccharide deacetylase family protein [uncultured Massilia sp.]